MSRNQELEAVRSARRHSATAKVVALRGIMSNQEGFEGGWLMLDGLRQMLASGAGYPRLFLAPREGGFALFLQISHGPRVWLIAEHSKRARIFKSLETATAVCRAAGADRVIVLLDETTAVAQVQEVNL